MPTKAPVKRTTKSSRQTKRMTGKPYILIKGIFMKNVKYIIFGVFVLCFLNGCVDPISITQIKIVNKSSYDLHISFYQHPDSDPDVDIEQVPADKWDNDFDLLKNKSVSYELVGSPFVYRDPNYEVEKALFIDINNNEEIKEYNNNNHNLFKLTGTEPNSIYGGTKASFLLEINDDLLNGKN